MDTNDRGLVRVLRPYGKDELRYKWVKPEGVRSPSKTKEGTRRRYRNARALALDAVGRKCVKCGFEDERALHIDHVEGGGGHERQRYRGSAYYYHIAKDPDPSKYQTLCANCNYIKRHEEQEYRKRDSP